MAKLECGCSMSPEQPIDTETLARHYGHTFAALMMWEIMRTVGSMTVKDEIDLPSCRIAYLEALRARFPQIPEDVTPYLAAVDQDDEAELEAADGDPDMARSQKIAGHLCRLMAEANAISFDDIEWLLGVTTRIEALEPLTDPTYFLAGKHDAVRDGAQVLRALRDLKYVVAGIAAFRAPPAGESPGGDRP